MNSKDLVLSKKLLSSYKERLEKEIISRSNKLRIPQKVFKEIINNNNEINEINTILQSLENNKSL